MKIGIVLNDVTVAFKLLSVNEMNIKRSAIRLLTGKTSGNVSELLALNDINLSITPGERVVISGQNGAGKTTLLRVISGALPPSKGAVSVSGRLLSLLGGPGESLDPQITGRENVFYLGILLGETPKNMRKLLTDIEEFSGLKDRLNTVVATYSSGMAARLRFSIITALRPQILIVDEGIASTADFEFASRARERLNELRARVEIVVWTSFGNTLDGLETRRLQLKSGRLIEP